MDESDDFNYYYHDLRKEIQLLSRRQEESGRVIIWAAIDYHGKTDIEFISGTMLL